MIDVQDKIRDQLLKWYEQPAIRDTMTLDQLAEKIGVCRSTLAKFMYNDKRLHGRTSGLVKSFLKSN